MCSFFFVAGTATLVELNRTYYVANGTEHDNEGIVLDDVKIAEITGIILFSILVGGFLGFCTAMRCNKGFKRHVSSSSFGNTLRKNSMLSRSFGLDPDFEYQKVGQVPGYKQKLNDMDDRHNYTYT